ncbi:MAG: hypothetical protein DMD87_00165 [Candidatus Rokuibacteriota bacterium]|nr:MAG: hypothetical protein DMD87_00165 [Candidatus Rokubacteria bacterium]
MDRAELLWHDRSLAEFRTLVQLTAERLRRLDYEQTPALVGPSRLLGRPVPWVRERPRRRAAPR